MEQQISLHQMTTEDLKATLNMYRLCRRNIKPEWGPEIHTNAVACAVELAGRIGPNVYSAMANGEDYFSYHAKKPVGMVVSK